MKLAVFKNTWEMAGTLSEQLPKIRAAGYDGVETAVPADRAGANELRRRLDDYGLLYIGMLFCEDAGQLEEGMHLAMRAGAERVTVHAGRDSMPFSEGCAYFESALTAQQNTGARAAYEPHRGRLLFTPWTTAAYLRHFPTLELCADFSHWVTVCERLPEDGDLQLAISRTAHIHARVGHPQGPQVFDPGAPEWSPLVDHYFRWWQAMADSARARGETLFTVDPEFGPPPYLPTFPSSPEPAAHLWEVILNMTKTLRQRLKIKA